MIEHEDGDEREREREPDDAALVAAARQGDTAAFGFLVARHRPLLIALCRRALGDEELAADAAQEAVLQAMLALERLRRPERFGSWLAGIGLNVCHRLRRQRSRDVWSWDALLGGRVVAEPCDPTPGPADLVEAAERPHRTPHAKSGRGWRSSPTAPPRSPRQWRPNGARPRASRRLARRARRGEGLRGRPSHPHVPVSPHSELRGQGNVTGVHSAAD